MSRQHTTNEPKIIDIDDLVERYHLVYEWVESAEQPVIYSPAKRLDEECLELEVYHPGSHRGDLGDPFDGLVVER